VPLVLFMGTLVSLVLFMGTLVLLYFAYFGCACQGISNMLAICDAFFPSLLCCFS
jgi:hypothetical protein